MHVNGFTSARPAMLCFGLRLVIVVFTACSVQCPARRSRVIRYAVNSGSRLLFNSYNEAGTAGIGFNVNRPPMAAYNRFRNGKPQPSALAIPLP